MTLIDEFKTTSILGKVHPLSTIPLVLMILQLSVCYVPLVGSPSLSSFIIVHLSSSLSSMYYLSSSRPL